MGCQSWVTNPDLPCSNRICIIVISVLPVVPQLDDAVVQAGEDPWPLRVERQSLHPGTLWRKEIVILCFYSEHFKQSLYGFRSIVCDILPNLSLKFRQHREAAMATSP